MAYILILLLGMIGGAICVFVALDGKRKRLEERKRKQDARAERIEEAVQVIRAKEQELIKEINAKRQELAELTEQAKEMRESKKLEIFEEIKAKREELEEHASRLRAAQEENKLEVLKEINSKQQELYQQVERLKLERADFEARLISYKELQNENTILKRDLQNVDVNLRKLQLDRDLQRQTQETLDQRGRELGSRYLKESVKWIGSSLNTNNFINCKDRLQKVIGLCRDIGFDISVDEESVLLADLKQEYEMVVRAALEREEQARIKAQMREEQALEKEIEQEREQLEREGAAVQEALEKALAEAKEEHSAEVDALKAKLAELEAQTQRAISRAQLTKAGHVYVISNIGSFGKGIFKVGMTRREEFWDRIKELSDASVPFPFDVHMQIFSDNAPALENALHRALHKLRVNKVNPRKEFFKTDIEIICQIVKQHHGEVEFVADAEALEYNQSLTMSDEDEEFIENIFDKIGQQK